ncbi:phosphate ABC transporter substrate-binding protein PstS [Kineosporia rhizophila]|uniref:phosphate ABC transporter substrate-binding protein PstS n=1 Tax=Kineosporia TaxID=49184 RepID=UPI001E311901|nr:MULTISPECIES: phosphate ABC transporter substrate-binding protein PstS [Kineosporia]MCE0539832.1 phosphate ABC transporter substrate-binding protein PstS [Kineosporia rhizophila]GLY13422.1 phosphate-binding protein PstS [Kineosporia sp. NBRC 101677]
MKLPKHVALTSVALAGALALTACGSDDNSGGEGGSGAEGTSSSVSGTLNGEGSSAQKNAIEEVISSFQDENPDATVNYNATGSGDGVKNFIAKQVDFAGSDSALKDEAVDGVVETDQAAERCAGNEAWNLPLVAGPIAIAYNLEGVEGLVLTPQVASEIFLGTIKSWDDPKIAALNEGVELPKTAISVFFRSDESGTTENFQKYLSGSAPDAWTAEPSKVWPGKVGEGRTKSDGVSQGVKSVPGGITYVEWSYATSNDLGVAKIDNGGGAVELTGESAGAALTAAEVVGEGNDLKLKLDYATKEAGVYPAVLVTYEIVCSKGLDADKTTLVKAFLKHFASSETQSGLQEAGYAPIPTEIADKVNTAIDAIS